MSITFREIMDLGWWDRYCELTGTNPWIINEGRVDSSEQVFLDSDIVRQLVGLEPIAV